MASKADEFRTKAEEYRDLAESATKPYAIESIGGGCLNTGWRWLQPKTLQRIGNSSPSRVTAAARAKGRTPKWLEMKIPGPHTRSTKATSSEALTRRVLKRGGGNSNSKASRRTAPNRIVMSESRTTAAMRPCDWPANRAADGRTPALQVAKARFRKNWCGCQSVGPRMASQVP